MILKPQNQKLIYSKLSGTWIAVIFNIYIYCQMINRL